MSMGPGKTCPADEKQAEAKRAGASERICLSCSHRHYRTDIHGLFHGYKKPAPACEKCGGETEYTNHDADLTGDARKASIVDAFDYMESEQQDWERERTEKAQRQLAVELEEGAT